MPGQHQPFTAALLLALVAAPAAPALAADQPLPAYRIDLSGPKDSRLLADLQLDLVRMRPGHHAVALGWPGTLEGLKASGLRFTTLSRDLGRDYARRAQAELCRTEATTAAGVPPLGRGSMDGYWTWEEAVALLDSLARHDGEGILTAVDTLGYSVQGRPILALGLFDQSRPPGSRPRVLYTGLTHGREPMSMHSLLYFLCSLIEGYGRDPEATYLIRERELWFVPAVNPDGYVRNQETWRATGAFGFWRKNLRDNDGDGRITFLDGVDLNRNFGFRWGEDDWGSSPHPASQVYRGTEAFSEPEARALRDFCVRHAFTAANNVHSFYGATLYPRPRGGRGQEDGPVYERLVDRVTRHNGHAYGFSNQLLYPVNGDADEWLYAEEEAKPKCYAMTSEIGGVEDGFWPPPARMVELARANERAFRTLALGAGELWQVEEAAVMSPAAILTPGQRGRVRVQLSNVGLRKGRAETVTVHGGSPRGDVRVEPVSEPSAPGLREFTVTVHGDVPAGVFVPLVFQLTGADGYVSSDTVQIPVGARQTVFADDGSDGLRHWMPQGLWGREILHGNLVFSDSPGMRYPNGADASLTLASGLDLSGGDRATLEFRSQWNIENTFDFALVEASPDSGATWIPLKGRWTVPGSGAGQGGVQPPGAPVYQGNSRIWKDEVVDLSAFAGHPDLRLRFRLGSDRGLTQDGWLIDDIVVSTYCGLPQSREVAAAEGGEPAPAAPGLPAGLH